MTPPALFVARQRQPPHCCLASLACDCRWGQLRFFEYNFRSDFLKSPKAFNIMSDAQLPPFLRLPAELRNRIYELALPDRHYVHIGQKPFWPFKKEYRLPGLLQICAECAGIWYSTSTFTATNFMDMIEWLEGLPSEWRKHLKHLLVQNGFYSAEPYYTVAGEVPATLGRMDGPGHASDVLVEISLFVRDRQTDVVVGWRKLAWRANGDVPGFLR
jgi:hypothetical protein